MNNADKTSKRFIDLGKKIRKFLKAHPGKTYTRRQVLKRFVHEASKEEINIVLDFLITENRIRRTSDNRLQHSMDKNKQVVRKVEGIVDMAPSGVAYIIVDGYEDDVRVEKKDTNKALDGDKVLVGLYNTKRSARPRGEIIQILERSQEYYIGKVELSKEFAFVIPDKQSIRADFFINKKDVNGAKNGDKVIVKMLGWPEKNKNPDGEIVEVLGQSGTHDVEMKAILIENNFPLYFTPGVQKELDKITHKIPAEEIAKRRDIRETLTFTIDPVDAKDFDDAISFVDQGNGEYEIGVHIADVSHYVRPGSELEKNGYRRATSVYLVDRVLPMLPEKISNIICSLRPDEESLCFSVFFKMNDKAEVLSSHIEKTVIYSDRRFNYDEALEEIKKGQGRFGEPLVKINEITKKLRKNRYQNGSINFDSKELRFTLDQDGQIEAVKAKTRHDAHFLIEELMLLTNKTVAKYIADKKVGNQPVPFVYRIHDEPDPEKLQTFAMNAADFGHIIHTDNFKKLPFELNRFFDEIKGSPEERTLESLAIRSMSKAVYDTDNIGHYGLGFEYYSHFTSPIRRYPDLMVHRQLFDYLTTGKLWEKKAELQERCEHSSKMERKAVDAERESVKYFQTLYLEDKIEEDFTGIITGITSWGFYVEISDVFTEGLVRIQTLEDDSYEYDERKKQIVGYSRGKVFKIGQAVKVRIEHVSVPKRQVDLIYLNHLE